ncbi:MAG: hypothetical protein JW751_14550 [Polyangiaceae bacterium]|nr:hypothetical protein [Polyangiaceae bacterium]
MPKNQAILRLLEVERREDLWSRKVLGYEVWGLERLHRYQRELLGAETRIDVDQRGALAKALARFSGPVRRSAEAMLRGATARLRERDIWVLAPASFRRADERGERVCIFAEHLRQQLGERVLFLEYDPFGFPTPPRDDLLPIDVAMLGALGAGDALGRVAGGRLVDEPTLRAFAPTPAKLLVRDAVYGRAMRALMRRWLRHARPRAIFVLNGYHFFTPFLLEAKRERVMVIELQHGIIHESHPGYIHERVPPYLPDHLVVFGAHYGELLEREAPCWRGRWSVGGHPWMSKVLARQSRDEPRDAVVIFSQIDPPVVEVIRRWVPRLRALLPGDLRLVIKPHPREHDAQNQYGAVLGPGVELASHSDDSYLLLNRCRVAVGLYSTVVIEALAYPCRSVAIRCPFWTEDIRVLVDQGLLLAVDTPQQLAELAIAPATIAANDVAARLFGIGQAPLDFAALLRRVNPRALDGDRGTLASRHE